MTLPNPLFEFMPYGAPELIAVQRPNLFRALALASGLAITVFVLARVLGVAMPGVEAISISAPKYGEHLVERPPLINPRWTIPARPALRSKAGRILPVHEADEIAPPSDVPEDLHTGPTGGVVDGASDGPVIPGEPAPAVIDVLPERGVSVTFDEPAMPVTQIKPKYPDFPHDAGIEGRVYAFMLIGKDGRVIRAEIDEKHSNPMFNAAVLDAARQWVFTPARANGHPVAVWISETFNFTLH